MKKMTYVVIGLAGIALQGIHDLFTHTERNVS